MTVIVDTPVLTGGIRSVNFFNGRLLTARDFTREQEARRTADERLGQAAGDGVVWGLDVAPLAGNAPRLMVRKGLAVNRAGQTLQLGADTELALAPDVAGTAHPGAAPCFGPCEPLTGGTYVAGAGVYLLTLAPARATEGRAPTSALDSSTVACNIDANVDAVQFRAILLDAALANDDFRDGGRVRGDHEVRNRVAYKCFGAPALEAYAANPLGALAARVTLLDELGTSALSKCDVPLAVFYWTLTGGLRFVDPWAVRRRVALAGADARWDPLTGDSRDAAAEAMLAQFAEALTAIRTTPGVNPATVAAAQHLAWLPPAGYLPTGAGRFDWRTFLGAHAPASAMPLASGLARAVLADSFTHDPVRVRTGADAVRYRVYTVDGRGDYVLFARSRFGESLARDVAVEGTVCSLPAVTDVQTALDELCKRIQGCCTIVLTPGPNWWAPLAKLGANADAEICFQAGRYERPVTTELADLGHLKITGAGAATLLVNTGGECALRFLRCRSVTVRDLAVEGTVAGSRVSGRVEMLGALAFNACKEVEIASVWAKCAAAAERAAACISIRGTPTNPVRARVHGTRLNVGHAQVGLAVIDCERADIADNVIALGTVALGALANDVRHRVRLRRQILAMFPTNPEDRRVKARDASKRAAPNLDINYGNFVVPARTPEELKTFWPALLRVLDPKWIGSADVLAGYLKRIVTDAVAAGGVFRDLKDNALAARFRAAFDRYAAAAQTAAGQGIVVGGQVVEDVRITGNSIAGVEQGIHVGAARAEKRKGARLFAGTTRVSGNRIEVKVSAASTGERHAIFVGNCQSLVIEGNHARLTRTSALAPTVTDGVRLWGEYGKRLIVRENHVEGFAVGLLLRALNTQNLKSVPWVVVHNTFASATTLIQTEPSGLPLAVKSPNFS